ncbi:hypothetical protein C0992_012435, partial [Termitomyces sp. T32_za158]
FADVLEQLENSFYSQAISKFQDSDFTTAGFSSSQIPIEQFKNIQSDEASHSQTLQAAIKSLGETPITGCNFDFSSVLNDVSTMAATARVVENVGVSAYLGGATLLTDPVLLDAAGSILTTEARHQTILNVLSGTGTAIPAGFDIPFTPSEVLAVASPFMSGCNVPIPANTPLSITNAGTVAPGTLLTFKASTLNGTIPDSSMFCQMLVGGASMSISLPFSQCVVPDINGPVALFITSDGQPLLNNVRDRAQNNIVAGPTVAFIDTKPEVLGQLIRTGSNSTSQSTSTLTISPSQAASIVSSAGGASGTGSTATATAPSPSSSSTSSSPGNPNFATGLFANGSIIVNGWSNSPSSSNSNSSNGTTVSSAAASAPSSSSSISAQSSVTVSGGASQTASAAAVSSSPPTLLSPSSSNTTFAGGIIVNGLNSAGENVASATGASTTSSAVAAGTTTSPLTAAGGNNSTSPTVGGGIVVNSSSVSS